MPPAICHLPSRPRPVQPPLLKVKPAQYRAHTMSTATVRGVLGITTDEAVQLLQLGALWAWDLASPGSDPCYRFLTLSVTALTRDAARELLDDCTLTARPTPATAEAAIAALLKSIPSPVSSANIPWITSTRFAELFNIERTHKNDLIREGLLAQLPGTTFRKGPGGYAYLSRASVERFLTERLAC